MKFLNIRIQSHIILQADLDFCFFFLRKCNFSVHGLVELAAWLSDSRILSYDASNLFTLWVCSTVYFNLFSFWSNHSRSPSGCNCHQYKFHRKMTLSEVSHDWCWKLLLASILTCKQFEGLRFADTNEWNRLINIVRKMNKLLASNEIIDTYVQFTFVK